MKLTRLAKRFSQNIKLNALVVLLVSGTLGITLKLTTLTNLDPLKISGSGNWLISRGFHWISYLDWLFVSLSVLILGYLVIKNEGKKET